MLKNVTFCCRTLVKSDSRKFAQFRSSEKDVIELIIPKAKASQKFMRKKNGVEGFAYAVKQRNRPWWTKGEFKACDVIERSRELV